MSFDWDSLWPTRRRFARLAWFVSHVNSLLKQQDGPVSMKAPTAFAAHQRNIGIRFYKDLPSASTNRVLVIVEGLFCLANRTDGQVYFGTGVLNDRCERNRDEG